MNDILSPFQELFHGEISADVFKTRVKNLLQEANEAPTEITGYLDDLFHENQISERDYVELSLLVKHLRTGDVAARNPAIPDAMDTDIDATIAIAPEERQRLFEQKKFMGYLDESDAVGAQVSGVAEQAMRNDRAVDMDATIAIPASVRKHVAFMDYLDDGAPSSSGDKADSAVPPVANDLTLVGRVLSGRYKLETLLGKSSYFLIFSATDVKGDQNYVVKVIRPEIMLDHAVLITLDREIKRTQQLQHKNIVSHQKVIRDRNTTFLVMEKIEGQSLQSMLLNEYKHGMPSKLAFQILNQVVDALHYAHLRYVIHSDLRPSNIILTDNGEVKIFDFGHVRTLYKYQYSLNKIGMSATDPRMRSLQYSSCQMLEGAEATPSDDVYALACIAYEMLFGRHPFGKVNALEAKRLNIEAPNENLSREQWRGMLHGLAFEKARRYEDTRELLNNISPVGGFARHKNKLLAGVMLVLVVFGGYLGYPIWQDMQAQSLIDQVKGQSLSLAQLDDQLTFLDATHRVQVKQASQAFVVEQFRQDNIAAGLRALSGLTQTNAEILQHAEVKKKLIGYYKAQVKNAVNQEALHFNYTQAEAVVREAREYYPDSRVFAYLQEDLIRQKKEIFSRLSTRLLSLLNQGALLKEDAREDVFDVIEKMKMIKPDALQLASVEIADTYLNAIRFAPLGKKVALLDAGLTLLPNEQRLLDLQARLAANPAEIIDEAPVVREQAVARQEQLEAPTPPSQLAQLLKKLRHAVASNQLSEPEADNAVFYLKAMIQVDRTDPSIDQARSIISEKYLSKARIARKNGEWEKAQQYLNRATEMKLLEAQ